MSLVRWEPFNEMDSLLNRMLRKSFTGLPRLSVEGDGGAKLEWSPSADISETDKEYLIRAELPAVKKEDVRVTVNRGMITIEGERNRRERRPRSFTAWRACTAISREASRSRRTSTWRPSAAKRRTVC